MRKEELKVEILILEKIYWNMMMLQMIKGKQFIL